MITPKAPNTTIVKFANTADPDEMALNEPSHLDLQCLLSWLCFSDIYLVCVQGSTNGIPISFKVLPMVCLVPLVTTVMQMVPLALPMVRLVSQWYHWLPMVPLPTNGTIGKITNGTIGRTPNRASFYHKYVKILLT